jgi:hypothetical protein
MKVRELFEAAETLESLKPYFDFHITKIGAKKQGEFYVRKPGFTWRGWNGQVYDMADLKSQGLDALEDYLQDLKARQLLKDKMRDK